MIEILATLPKLEHLEIDPFSALETPTSSEYMGEKIIEAARFAYSEILSAADELAQYDPRHPMPSRERLAQLVVLGIDRSKRADCLRSYDYARAHAAQYLPDHLAICLAMALHEDGPRQRLHIGTLASASLS